MVAAGTITFVVCSSLVDDEVGKVYVVENEEDDGNEVTVL